MIVLSPSRCFYEESLMSFNRSKVGVCCWCQNVLLLFVLCWSLGFFQGEEIGVYCNRSLLCKVNMLQGHLPLMELLGTTRLSTYDLCLACFLKLLHEEDSAASLGNMKKVFFTFWYNIVSLVTEEKLELSIWLPSEWCFLIFHSRCDRLHIFFELL